MPRAAGPNKLEPLRSSVRYRSGVGGDADPGAVSVDPGINEAFAMNYGLASMGFLDRDHSDRDGSVSEDAHGERFGGDLLVVGIGGLHAGEELGLIFEGAVIFDQD